MIAGQSVIVRNPMLPGRTFRGVILRKTPNGFSVRYESFGIMAKQTFPASCLTPA